MRCYECGLRCEWADDMEGIKESEILCNACYDALEIKGVMCVEVK